MREDCIHFQSRSYDDGETARFCVLDLAPEAPWRCPADCHRYERLALAADFVVGSLARSAVEPEPDAAAADVVGVLDDAEEIVNAAAPAILAELQTRPRSRWRRRRRPDDGRSGLSQR